MQRAVGPAARSTLTPARVLEAAYTVIDAEGPEALTMRRLGAELGVVAMAIYNHFPDRDALLDAIAEHALGAIASRPRRGGWRTRLNAMIRDLRDLAVAHPHIYAMALCRPSKPPSAMSLMFEALDALREAGLSQRAAVRWYHTFVILLQGFPSWQANLARYKSISPADFKARGLTPRQQSDLQSVHEVTPTSQFDQSIKLLLDALDRS